MSTRRRKKPAADAFSEPSGSDNLQDMTNRGYGAPPVVFQADKQRITVKQLPIDQILPDPQQPRRVIPKRLKEKWSPEPEALTLFLDEWADTAGLNVSRYLNHDDDTGADDTIRPADPDSLTASLLTLLDVAMSIKRDGIINPITVVRSQGEYIIETGERRWLAYHLLRCYDLDSDNDWDTIPARIMDEFDIWRQASENNARDNLNAIAKARQLALLLMDLHGYDNFQPFDAFQHEQDYYAQVADGTVYRVPRGKGDELLQAMGLSDAGQIRQYRALLRIPAQFWEYADEHNLTEGEIRDAANRGYTVTGVTVAEADQSEKQQMSAIERFAERELPRIEKTLRKLEQKEKKLAIQYLEELLNKLRDG